jgi:predicted ATP-binding protein involved in virulence
MQIKQISVTGLFGIFDHVIPLNMDEKITIIHSPNGYGKTAILRLLDGFFNSKYSVLYDIPFHEFQVDFDNGSRIEISKTPDSLIIDLHEAGTHTASFTAKNSVSERISSSVEIMDSLVPITINSRSSDVNINFYGSMDRGKGSDEELYQEMQILDEPEWLKEINGNINIHFIESQRLLNFSDNKPFQSYSKKSLTEIAVSVYSHELAQLIKNKSTEYGMVAQSLDRTFPIRLFQQLSSPHSTTEQFFDRLHKIEETRSHLVDLGLLEKEEDSRFNPQNSISEGAMGALSVYVDDVEEKLRIFNDIEKKIDLLRKIINNKFAFSYKEIYFDKEKGFLFKILRNSSLTNETTLSPADLSSGEQHELVLVYELLFKVKPNSLILIDEPEISLHVGWQVQFLKDLREVIRLTSSKVLMATHSPDIIQDRWDLTVELKKPES